MVLSILLVILEAILLLKIGWNCLIPWFYYWKRGEKPLEGPRNVSLMPVEPLILILCLGLAWVIDGQHFWNSPMQLFIVGSVLIIGSYCVLYFTLRFLARLVRRAERK